MTELPIQGILEQFLGIVESRRIPYMIMGGFAVRALGVPRPTYDADRTIEASDEDLAGLLKASVDNGFAVPDEFLKGFKDSLSGMSKVKVQRFEQRHVWDVDLFLVTTEYQKSAFKRRQKVRFLGKERWMISPEDLILHKLLANRRKDLLDVEEVLKVHRGVDVGYLRRWGRGLGIAERVEAAVGEAGLSG